LPPEIRNRIYTYYFETATINIDLKVRRVADYQTALPPVTTEPSALSLTCRQLHIESRTFRDTPQYLTINSQESFSACMTSLNLHRRYLVKVRELEITTRMAEDILGHLQYHDFPHEGSPSNRDPDDGKVFPALEVVVWPIPVSGWFAIHPSETREQQREAAVRYCFGSSSVRSVLAPLRDWY
jgi:hypothetical protein